MKKTALLLATILLVTLFAGCSSSSSMDTASSTIVTAPQAAMEESMTMTTTDSATGGETFTQTVDYTEKIIYSAYLSLETTNFDSATSQVEQLVTQYGGFLESAEQSGNTRYGNDGSTQVVDRFAYYTLRVPSDQFDALLSHADTLGNLVDSSRQAENITSAFMDQEALKTSLEIQEERLLSMMEQSEDIETLIALEARISEVRFEIDTITRQLNNWQMDVDYSTVSIAIQEVEVYTPTAQIQRTFGEKVADSFQDGVTSFVSGCQFVLLFLIGNFLGLLLFFLVGAGIVVIIRKVRARKEKIMGSKTDEMP
ncbi:MAG: DUF4349 domain-containing protein [Eubacteriales bacterium]